MTILTAILCLAFPLAVSANAAITSFHMDRTTVQVGQTITLTVHTNAETTHVFAEIGGTRTQGAQTNQNATTGIRTWNITLNPAAGATRIDVFANTANTAIGEGVVTLSIPITVSGTVQTQQPGTPVPALAIVSVTEIQATAVNQARLEIVTGLGATEVWVTRGTPQTFHRATRVNTSETTQVWQVTINNINPIVHMVQISANVGYYTRGATTQDYRIQNTAPFVPPANPLIVNTVPNPAQVPLGGTSTVSITTNNEVNFVWIMVGNTRVNATRTNPTSIGLRTWTATIAPSAADTITAFANVTDTNTGAFTQNVAINTLQTRVTISNAIASWHPNASEPTHVRIVVHTNLYATDLWVNVGNRQLNFNRTTDRIQSGSIWIWEQTFTMEGFANNVPIHIHASDIGNIFSGSGFDAHVTLSGVGGLFINQPGQGNQVQNAIWGTTLNPAHVSREMLWPIDTMEFSTANDVTAVRVRDAAWNIIVPETNTYTVGQNNSRVWTLRNIWVNTNNLPASANNISLTVQIRRGSSSWIDVPAISIPVW